MTHPSEHPGKFCRTCKHRDNRRPDDVTAECLGDLLRRVTTRNHVCNL